MLPILTFGTVSAYQTIGLPKLLQPNGTGIIIDIHQMSWLCKNVINIYSLGSTEALFSNSKPASQGPGLLPLRGDI